MKRTKKLFFLLLACCLLLAVPVSAQTVKDGWKKTEEGQMQYYQKGKPIRGFRKLGANTYYFNEKGYLQKNIWITRPPKKYRTDSKGIVIRDKVQKISGKYYYFRPNGTMYSGWKQLPKGKSYFGPNGVRRTGLQKIGGKTYLIGDNGYLLKGTKKIGNTTYYLSDGGVVEMKVVNSKGKTTYYDAKGKSMNSIKVQDYLTLVTARNLVAKITNSKMSKEQKLKACFDWVISKPYITRRIFSNVPGWTAVYANDHFLLGGGDCNADAAAFAYLAKALGYTKIYVCVDSDGAGGSGHCWTEINGLVYDPLFAEAKDYASNYGVPYGVYILHPILHIAI